MNVLKVTLSQLQGHWTKVTDHWRVSVVTENGSSRVLSIIKTMPWTVLFWCRPETRSKTRQYRKRLYKKDYRVSSEKKLWSPP